jgi:nucleotide-binding universal stress UspA family protein
MRKILLHVYDDDCFEARLQVALDIARRFDGRITCLQAVPYDYGMPSDFYGAMSAQMVMEYDKVAKEIREKIEPRLAKEDVPWSWISSSGSASILLVRHAPIHDLVVVGTHNPMGKKNAPSRLVGDLIEQVRGPLLVVPPNARSFDVEKPAVVAWNGSVESAHALRAAVPFLSHSSSVHVVCVEEKKEAAKFDLPSTLASEYLADYGIKSETTELDRDGSETPARMLLGAARAREAGYMVMGAYGHSRLREQVLGGVTREMLTNPEIPLLMSH